MKYFSLFLLMFSFCEANAQKVTINGHAEFKDSVQKIYLLQIINGKRNLDSSLLENGKFSFKENIQEPSLAYLRARFKNLGKSRYESLPLFIEPGHINIEIKDSLKNAKVSGSRSNLDYQMVTQTMEPYTKKNLALRTRRNEFWKDKNEEGTKQVETELDKLDNEIKENVYRKFFNKHPNSPVALYALEQYIGYDIDAKKVAPMFARLSASAKKSPSGIALGNRIKIAEKTGVGTTALNFTQNDTLDKPVSLSDFRGKYVLLDFWASWCGPCRAENPNVVKAFNEYKGKNFTVLSVSLDKPGKKQSWLDAIHKDGLTWTHVSDLKFWDNAVAKQYGISAIPQNLLIDPQGKIIAKNITGEELNKKLEELVK